MTVSLLLQQKYQLFQRAFFTNEFGSIAPINQIGMGVFDSNAGRKANLPGIAEHRNAFIARVIQSIRGLLVDPVPWWDQNRAELVPEQHFQLGKARCQVGLTKRVC